MTYLCRIINAYRIEHALTAVELALVLILIAVSQMCYCFHHLRVMISRTAACTCGDLSFTAF